jgi:hypothetical protein
MKKLIFAFMLLVVNQLAFAQTESVDRFVRKYKRTATGDKVDLTVPGWLIRMGSNFIKEEQMEGVDVKALCRKLNEIRIVAIEGGHQLEPTEFNQIIKDVKAENYEELINVRESKGSRISIMMRERKGFIRDLFIMVHERDEFVLLDIGCKLTMEDISEIFRNVETGNGKKLIKL